MKAETIETLIWIFCIVALFSLTVKVSLESTEYTCDECRVSLSNSLPGSDYYEYANVKISKLLVDYKDGRCTYVWDPVQGYILNGNQ